MDTYWRSANHTQTIVRSKPDTSSSQTGTIAKDEIIKELEKKDGDNYQIWIRCDKGWVLIQDAVNNKLQYYFVKVPASEIPVVEDVTEEVGEPEELTLEESLEEMIDDEEDYGYIPPIDEIVSKYNQDLSNNKSDFYNISSVTGVFGLPYQFLPSADIRLDPADTYSEFVSAIGSEYAENIIGRIPLLFLTPGRADFMTRYSKQSRESILEKLITGGDNNRSTLDDLLKKSGRYYTFRPDEVEYYKFVNPMCRIAARYMNIQDFILNNTALDSINWMNYTRSGISSFGDLGSMMTIPFYINTDTSIQESFGNNTTQSMLSGTVNGISDMGRELNFLLGYTQSAAGAQLINNNAEVIENMENVQDLVKGMLGSGNFLSNLTHSLTTAATGGKLLFPEIWADSDFSRSYNVNIKLQSPDPNLLSIYLNVLVPLFHLIGFVAPQAVTDDPNAYTNPFIVRGTYKGMFNVDMGIITSMSVSKGAECQWTPNGIPTSIEVDLTIKDLYQAMSITKTESSLFQYDTLDNTALMDYIATTCGINVYKPEIGRTIDMQLMNLSNRVTDLFRVNIFGGVQQAISRGIMDLFRS